MAYEIDDFLRNKTNMLFRYLLKMDVSEEDAQEKYHPTLQYCTHAYLSKLFPHKRVR